MNRPLEKGGLVRTDILTHALRFAALLAFLIREAVKGNLVAVQLLREMRGNQQGERCVAAAQREYRDLCRCHALLDEYISREAPQERVVGQWDSILKRSKTLAGRMLDRMAELEDQGVRGYL